MMNLQNLCIRVIVDEFERYYLAFNKSDDASLKRKLEFLQRKYSYQIASELYNFDKMEISYLDILINKYLKALDTNWFKDSPWKSVAAKIAEIGPNLQKIYFHELSEELPWQDVIHHLTNLEVMSFPCDCNDAILKCVAKSCPNIVEIDASDCCDITDEGIKYLCMKEDGKLLCPKLKILLISECNNIREEGIKYLLKNLRSLELLDFHSLPVILHSLHENELSMLDKVEPYNITSLDLSGFQSVPFYTDLLKVCLSVCPHLKSLVCPISRKEHLDLFSNPLELEKLHLEGYSNPENNVTNLLKLVGKKITTLTLSWCSLSVSTLAKSCPHLKQLQLIHVTFKNDDDDITPIFHCLEACEIDQVGHGSSFNKSVSLLLKNSPKLEHIAFKRCDLSEELKIVILKCCESCPIKKVNFSGTVVDVIFAKDILMNCHSLQCIKLGNSSIISEEEDELYRLAELLPNNPTVIFSEDFTFSDIDDDMTNIYNDFTDYEDYDDYDDFYHYDDDDDYYDVDDDDYGCYFEL